MISRARSKALQGLIAGTLALFSYFPDAEASAAGSTDPFVEALVAEVERGELEPLDRSTVLRRLALSPHRGVRMRVAEAAGALSSEEPEAGLALLRQLSHDATGEVRNAAARGLAEFIRHAPDPARSAVESEWATAEAEDERVALARALGMSRPDWLTDLALVELAGDARATVRRAAVHAAGIQLERNPAAYLRVAAARIDDPDRRVRKAARHALRQAEARGLIASLRPSPRALRESRKRLRRALREREPSARIA
jgi:HEAT repeat protein